jgi:methyl-accepting chemotaxis protein
MLSLSHLTIRHKLWLLTFCTGFGITVLTIIFLVSERTLIMRERQAGVQQVVEVAHGVAARYQSLSASGAMTDADARQAALSELKTLRYSGSEYFWINDLHPTMVMHPTKPEMDGKDLTEVKDPEGKQLFVEAAAIGRTGGGGFIFYMWPKPGSDQPVPKVSFVKGFAPWGWVIGSGVYVDTVNSAVWGRAEYFGVAATLFCALLIGLSILVAHTIVVPLGRAVEIATTVAGGDLSSEIEAKGSDETAELLRALASMNHSLHAIVCDVRNGTETIASASGQIAAGNLDLSARTEEQASSLEQTASAMEQLTATVRENAEHARQANALAGSASDVALKGGSVVARVVDTMGTINAASRKIADIISVIDGIAFQTNILALNAAVEAARAGEQGRGFAVVASEVRNLAQRSAAAAKEIKALIEHSVETVDAGSVLVAEAGSTMHEIVESVRRVTDIMGDISNASREQELGIGEINLAVAQMDAVTQQNAALVEEAAAAAEALEQQAGALARTVSVFKLEDSAVSSLPPRLAARGASELAVRSVARSKPAVRLVANGEAE